MRFNPQKHHRRSIRLKNYDYSQPGMYFVTICSGNKEMLFGDVINCNMILNESGKYTQKCWRDISKHFSDVRLDEFIIMPNHVHRIICVVENDDKICNVGAKCFSPLHQNEHKFQSPIKTIGSIIRGFKIGVTKYFLKNIHSLTNVFFNILVL